MIKDTEKRTDKRQDCDGWINWAHFNRTAFNHDPEMFYRARVLNFSKSGLYFETTYYLKPGTIILFRLEEFVKKVPSIEGCECVRSISLVEIKWYHDILKNGESFFGIGARYPIAY